MDKGVKIRMDFDRLVHLGKMYEYLMKNFDSDSEHEELLIAHMKELHHRLKVMAVKEQGVYLFSLSNPEAMAFKQAWQYVEYEPATWEHQIIKSIQDSITKRFNQLKRIEK